MSLPRKELLIRAAQEWCVRKGQNIEHVQNILERACLFISKKKDINSRIDIKTRTKCVYIRGTLCLTETRVILSCVTLYLKHNCSICCFTMTYILPFGVVYVDLVTYQTNSIEIGINVIMTIVTPSAALFRGAGFVNCGKTDIPYICVEPEI